MELEGRFDGDGVHVGGDARQRFHDARGYGYPLSGNEIALAPVEAAHLLYRDDLAAVIDDGERLDFRGFLAREPGSAFGVRFLVYADLRSRGFYLSPAREPWVDDPPAAEFAVFPRGKGPGDGELEYALRVVGERTDVPAATLESGALAVVDEESEITYFEVSKPNVSGTSASGLPTGVDADLLADRVVLWEPPLELYERTFYGQPLEGREYDRPTLQCSLLEAAHLAEAGAIDLEAEAILERGRTVEGDRFDRRLTVYRLLREAGIVPKTGYKFGADFRTYADVESVDDLGHSELLIRVLPADHVFEPRDLSLDVRLAHGVRKTMVFALVEDGEVEWWSFERLTP
ncbi:tRNA-intron lyase [Natronosalvus vescus]|uniref:tRNA-intron lyase n=1 Tax=Natronosalvus vescus TaxID=2953881 RepID=UPI0020911BA9|nr:tRNA-intron lyase [Natronosalvus vescus]